MLSHLKISEQCSPTLLQRIQPRNGRFFLASFYVFRHLFRIQIAIQIQKRFHKNCTVMSEFKNVVVSR